MKCNRPVSERRFRPVSKIANHWVAPTRGLKPNLMRPPRAEVNLEKRTLAVRFERLPVEDGAFSSRMPGVDKSRLAIGLGDVVRPRADATKRALNEDHVPLFDESFSKLSRQLPGRVGGPSQNHDPRCGPVEPMDQPEKRVGPLRPGQPLLASRQNIGIARAVGLGKHSGRLVDDQQVLVVMENGHEYSSKI